MENVIKTGIIVEPDDKRDILTEFENEILTEDKNYMLPLRELWDKTPDKKTLMWLEVFYAPAPYYNSIRNIISDDIVCLGHNISMLYSKNVNIDDVMYFPNKMLNFKELNSEYFKQLLAKRDEDIKSAFNQRIDDKLTKLASMQEGESDKWEKYDKYQKK